MYALVDCNACYASCEEIFRPDLRGTPVVVLSNNDGCIITQNKQAKALGIPELLPYFKIRRYLEEHRVTVFSSNYELYGDISRRIMMRLADFANQIEVYSIDEAFLDVSGFTRLDMHGHLIRRTCWKEQRMPVAVGFGPTKTLAKLANHISKKSGKLNGVCIIDDPNEWDKVFAKLPVQAVWGIGKRLASRLARYQIRTVADLCRWSPTSLRGNFSITVERTIRELRGEPCLEIETQPAPRQQVFCSRSFSRRITDAYELAESVAHYAGRAAEKLRTQKSVTACIYVMMETSRFSSTPCHQSQTQYLATHTNDSRTIIEAARSIALRMYRPHQEYAKAGVGLVDLRDQRQYYDLFAQEKNAHSQVLMRTLDKINQRYGRNTAFIASQGTQRTWSMARAMKSPSYTTQLGEIPVIRI